MSQHNLILITLFTAVYVFDTKKSPQKRGEGAKTEFCQQSPGLYLNDIYTLCTKKRPGETAEDLKKRGGVTISLVPKF